MPFIDLHTHSANSQNEVLTIRNVFPNQFSLENFDKHHYFSIGLHPWYILADRLKTEMAIVEKNATLPNCLALGETGLDRLTTVTIELQEKVFTQHLEIAREVSKPVIIHCVRAFSELIRLHKPFSGKVILIIHGFNNNRRIVNQLLGQGYFLSFGKSLLNQGSNASKLFREIPDNRFFLETDEAEISIYDVYNEAARLKNMALDDLKTRIIHNFESCFGKMI